jgi:hypothetical protein
LAFIRAKLSTIYIGNMNFTHHFVWFANCNDSSVVQCKLWLLRVLSSTTVLTCPFYATAPLFWFQNNWLTIQTCGPNTALKSNSLHVLQKCILHWWNAVKRLKTTILASKKAHGALHYPTLKLMLCHARQQLVAQLFWIVRMKFTMSEMEPSGGSWRPTCVYISVYIMER